MCFAVEKQKETTGEAGDRNQKKKLGILKICKLKKL